MADETEVVIRPQAAAALAVHEWELNNLLKDLSRREGSWGEEITRVQAELSEVQLALNGAHDRASRRKSEVDADVLAAIEAPLGPRDRAVALAVVEGVATPQVEAAAAAKAGTVEVDRAQTKTEARAEAQSGAEARAHREPETDAVVLAEAGAGSLKPGARTEAATKVQEEGMVAAKARQEEGIRGAIRAQEGSVGADRTEVESVGAARSGLKAESASTLAGGEAATETLARAQVAEETAARGRARTADAVRWADEGYYASSGSDGGSDSDWSEDGEVEEWHGGHGRDSALELVLLNKGYRLYEELPSHVFGDLSAGGCNRCDTCSRGVSGTKGAWRAKCNVCHRIWHKHCLVPPLPQGYRGEVFACGPSCVAEVVRVLGEKREIMGEGNF